MTLDEAGLTRLVVAVLERHGLVAGSAALVAAVVVAAERDGSMSHGLLRLPGYVSTLRSGWVDGAAVPTVSDAAPGLIMVDGHRCFAQVALAAVRSLAVARVRSQGVVAVCMSNTHHFAALWPDVEPFAEAGLVALTMVNARSWMVVWGGARKVLGTNPMAFACPRRDGPPLVWDQASSLHAQGELLLARKAGRQVSDGAGVDAAGQKSTDPAAILEGGAMLPFGGHKGAAIAFMVEVMAAALSGGRFGFENRSADYPGAQTSNAGQFLLLIDPTQAAGTAFHDRIEGLLAELRAAGSERLPGDARRRHRGNSITISEESYRELLAMAG